MEKLLLLDLDETMVHTEEILLHNRETFNISTPDLYFFKDTKGILGDEYYAIRIRPHAQDFIDKLNDSGKYRILIWSASSINYINFVLTLFKNINPVAVFDSRRCTMKCFCRESGLYGEKYIIKDLKKIWKIKSIRELSIYKSYNTVVVDDNPSTYCRNYGNAIKINPYYGGDSDIELLRILNILLLIRDENNVREALAKFNNPISK